MSDVVVGRNSVSFHVSRTGVPVEVRMTYFPWWEAKNADGPWRLAPDDLVVVPTGHDVVLTAQPRLIDHSSLVVSGLAVLATIGLALWDRRRRRQCAPTSSRGTVAHAPIWAMFKDRVTDHPPHRHRPPLCDISANVA